MNTHGGYFGKNKKRVIDFSVNLNPMGVPDTVKDYIKDHLDALNTYPEIDACTARAHLALRHGVDMNQIIMGNGAVELIYLLSRTIKPKKVLLLQPTFNEYERAFRQSEAVCLDFQLMAEDDFKLDIKRLLHMIQQERPEVMVMCNPNNPTGTYFDVDVIEKLIIALKAYGGILMIDESFSAFEELPTALSLLDYENLLLLRSMTKFYAIAGIRLGYGIGSIKMINQMKAHKEPWTLNSIASEIVDVLIKDAGYALKTKKWYQAEKRFFVENMSKISFLHLFESKANFFLCKSDISSEILKKRLLEQGIYIRTCHDFVGLGDQYIRLALRSRNENKRLFCALSQIQDVLTDRAVNE